MRATEFIVETAMMGKIADSGKIIRILKKAHTVPFSDEKNWLLVDTDPGKGNSGLGIKWIPADTRFEWVRPYRDTVEQGVAEGLNEFAVSGNGDGGDDSLFNYAKMWYNGDLKTQRQVEKALQKVGLDIGENEDENGGAYISDKSGDYYESWTAEDLEQGVAEGQDDKAEAYRAHLIKTLPQIMKLFANIGKGWIPSKEQMLSAVDTAYRVMKHTGDVKQAGKVLMDELNTLYRMSQGKQGVAEGTTVTRIDSKPITDFLSSLKAYKHTDDWSQSGVDTGDDSYWKNKNLKTNTTKGLFAGDPKRTALYATGNAHETRYVEFTQDGQPIVYFDRKDLPAMRSRKTYLTVFDASDFRQLPTGEWFSENPSKPIKQVPIGDPFKYIASQGWIVRVTDDLDKVFKQVKNMHKAGKIAQYGAEGMNESKQGVAEGFLNEIYKMPPTKDSSQGMTTWAYNDAVEKKSPVLYRDSNVIIFKANEDLLRYIILQDGNPVLYIGLSKFLDGYKSGTVATEVAGRGKGLAQKAYLNVSDILGVPIYSDTTQTDASRLGIWDKLIQQYPERIVGYDQKTNKNLPLSMTDKGPVVNQNQPIYVDRNKKDTTKPIAPNQRYRTRVLKLLPIKQGVAEGLKSGRQRTNEKINPEILSRKFRKQKDLGWYRLEAQGDALGRAVTDPPTLKIVAKLVDKTKPEHQWIEIGEAIFFEAPKEGPYAINNTGDGGLIPEVSVHPEYQRKGIASEMYKFVKELGNDVVRPPSGSQSDDAVGLWKSFEKQPQGVAEEETTHWYNSGIKDAQRDAKQYPVQESHGGYAMSPLEWLASQVTPARPNYIIRKIVVIGDSIAVGIGQAIKGAVVNATVGINSSKILSNVSRDNKVQGAKLAIVSAGSNDIVKGKGNPQKLTANIAAIKDALNAEKYVWILPYDKVASQAVSNAVGGDKTVDLKSYPSSDGLHPSSYSDVAKAARAGLNLSSTAPGALRTKDGLQGVAEDQKINLDTDYFMNEGCGIFAVATALNEPGSQIYIISNKEGESWSKSFPYEITHVFANIPGKGQHDVRGKRSLEEMASDFGLDKGDYSVKGPFDPKEFFTKFMGNSDSKPIYGTVKDIKQVQKQIQPALKQGMAEGLK